MLNYIIIIQNLRQQAGFLDESVSLWSSTSLVRRFHCGVLHLNPVDRLLHVSDNVGHWRVHRKLAALFVEACEEPDNH